MSRSTGSGRLDADPMSEVWVARPHRAPILDGAVRKPAGRVACQQLAAFVLVLVTVFACQPAAAPSRSADPNADVVVPYSVDGGGTIRFTVRPRYPAGGAVTLMLDIAAGSQRIRGPLSGRVLASGLEGEKVVRMLGPNTLDAVDVAPNTQSHATITWDGHDDVGSALGPDSYSLALDFVVAERPLRIGSVIQIVAP